MRVLQINDLPHQITQAVEDAQRGETTQILENGHVIAQIVPPPPRLSQAEIEAALKSLDDLAAEIGQYVTEPTNAAEVLSQMRR